MRIHEKSLRDLLEALRGKTVLNSVLFHCKTRFATKILQKSEYRLSIQSERDVRMDMPFDFIEYVNWDYAEHIMEVNNLLENVKGIRLCLRQIFEPEKNTFEILFSDSGITFFRRENIDDTLFLDLQRYLEEHKIPYSCDE